MKFCVLSLGHIPGHLLGHKPGHLLGHIPGHLLGQRTGADASSNCWAVTTTPQIWEAGRPRPQEKGVPGRVPGHLPGHLPGQTLGQILGQKLGILTLIPFHTR